MVVFPTTKPTALKYVPIATIEECAINEFTIDVFSAVKFDKLIVEDLVLEDFHISLSNLRE